MLELNALLSSKSLSEHRKTVGISGFLLYHTKVNLLSGKKLSTSFGFFPENKFNYRFLLVWYLNGHQLNEVSGRVIDIPLSLNGALNFLTEKLSNGLFLKFVVVFADNLTCEGKKSSFYNIGAALKRLLRLLQPSHLKFRTSKKKTLGRNGRAE